MLKLEHGKPAASPRSALSPAFAPLNPAPLFIAVIRDARHIVVSARKSAAHAASQLIPIFPRTHPTMGVPRQCDEPGGVALTPHAGQSAHATSAAAVRPVPEVLYLPAAHPPSRHADASEVFPLCSPYLAIGHAAHMGAVAALLLLCLNHPAEQSLTQLLDKGFQIMPVTL